MRDPIVPESILRAMRQPIQECVAERRSSYSVDFADPDYGSAFVYYLVFSHCPSVSNILGVDLDDKAKFYNAYYWFQRFVKLHTDKCGYDAGLEQQAFQLLEGAELDFDLEVIDMIDAKAKE